MINAKIVVCKKDKPKMLALPVLDIPIAANGISSTATMGMLIASAAMQVKKVTAMAIKRRGRL